MRIIALLIALLLAACGLEPVYLEAQPRGADDSLRWVSPQGSPPQGYVPVVFTPPDGSEGLGVCRSFVVEPRGNEQGYSIGQIPPGPTPLCMVSYEQVSAQLSPESGLYQQLWAHPATPYGWVAPGDLPDEGLLVATRLYQHTRLPIEPVRRISDGVPIGAWLPCATSYGGRWYMGKAHSNGRPGRDCYVGRDGAEIRVSDRSLIFYAPVDE